MPIHPVAPCASSRVPRLACAAVALALVVAPLRAQVVERPVLRPDLPPRTRSLPPAPAPNPAPPPAPAPAPAPIAGYEIVAGTPIDVGPLSSASALVQCPAGKIVLSVAYDFGGADDATFGYEPKGGIFGIRTYDTQVSGADPARLAAVRGRNANVFVRGTLRPFAICATPPAGLRQQVFGSSDDRFGTGAACTAGERLVGGAAASRENTLLAVNAPQGPADGARWAMFGTRAGPGAPGTHGAEGVALCAAGVAVDGWEYVESLPVTLNARSRAQLTVQCPAGKVVLAAGVAQRSANWLDMIVNRLVVTPAGGASAQVHNRNTINGSGAVQAVLGAACARRA